MPSTAWKAGESGNPDGRPTSGGLGKPISPLRRNLTSLRRLEPRALEILEASLLTPEELEKAYEEGTPCAATRTEWSFSKKPTKEQLDSAKFVVRTIESATKGATSDELNLMRLRREVFEDSDFIDNEPVEEEESKPRFRLNMSEEQVARYEEILETHK